MQGGDRMTVVGLVSAAHYNGQTVTLVHANDSADRSAESVQGLNCINKLIVEGDYH